MASSDILSINETLASSRRPSGATREFDLIIFGATGYTGRLACAHLLQNASSGESDLPVKWAIAGRKKSELNSLCTTLGKDRSKPNITYVVTDLGNHQSVVAMTARCKVLSNFVGPYALHGEAVIKACIETHTHYVDATAEIFWVKDMISKYDDVAKQNKLKVMVCAGFDFVPNDMMIFQACSHIEKCATDFSKHPTDVTHCFKTSTAQVSGGTARSGLLMLSQMGWREAIALFTDPYVLCDRNQITNMDPIAKDLNRYQIFPHYVAECKEYCTPFVMSGLMSKFILWSNQIQGNCWGDSLVYRGGEGRSGALFAFFYAMLLWVQFGLALILSRLPSLWDFVTYPPGEGPPISSNAFMESTLVATFPTTAKSDNSETKVTVTWKLKGREAYGAAALFVMEAAKVILKDDGVSGKFGVISPCAGIGPGYLKALESCSAIEMVVDSKIVD